MSRVVFWGLLALIALVPLPLASDRPLPWSVMALWVGVLLALWAIFVARHRPLGSRSADRYLMPIALLFGACIVWLVVQTAAPLPQSLAPDALRRAAALLDQPAPPGIGLDADAAWTTLMRMLAYAGVLFLAWEYGRNRQDAGKIALTVLLATLGYSLYGLLVQLAGLKSVLWFAKTAYSDSVTGPFINRNSFATYIVVGLAVALAMVASSWLRQKKRRFALPDEPRDDLRTALLLLAVMLLAVALVMTRSRGGFYSLGVAVVGGGGALVLGGALRGRKLLTALAGVAVVAIVVLAAGGAGLAGRFTTDTTSVEASRGAIFTPTIAAIRERPLTGYGLGSFQGVFEAVNDGTLYKAGYRVDKAHNTYLEMALEGGIPVAIALSLCLLALAAPCALAVVRRRGVVFGLSGTIATLAVGAHAVADFSLQMPAVAVTFLALLGASSSQSLRLLGKADQDQTDTV